MNFEVGVGTETYLIFFVLSSEFPKYMELKQLKEELDREKVISESELNKYLVYLEDKNWIRKEENKFRITAYGYDKYIDVISITNKNLAKDSREKRKGPPI